MKKINWFIIGGVALVVLLILNANPRFIKQDLPSIGIVGCECSIEYDIECKSWLHDSARYTCHIEDDEICGTCIKKSSISPTSPTPSVKAAP